MPAFWPGAKPLNPKLPGGKDADRQIDSVRVYLTEADQRSRRPVADAAAYELKPTERPIVFRTFIDGAGTHAIAVGFPPASTSRSMRWSHAGRSRGAAVFSMPAAPGISASPKWNSRSGRA